MTEFRRVRLRLVVLAGIAVHGLAGCGNGKPAGVEFAEVTGAVTLDGQPLPQAFVSFQPAEGRPSYGRTDAAGRYSLRYRGKDWGAVVGKHTVKITTENLTENPETGEVIRQAERLPTRYHRRTTLEATVQPGDNAIDFALESETGQRRS